MGHACVCGSVLHVAYACVWGFVYIWVMHVCVGFCACESYMCVWVFVHVCHACVCGFVYIWVMHVCVDLSAHGSCMCMQVCVHVGHACMCGLVSNVVS